MTYEAKRDDLQAKLMQAALDLAEHTKDHDFCVRIPCTAPALEVCVRPVVEVPQRRATDALPTEPLQWDEPGTPDALHLGYRKLNSADLVKRLESYGFQCEAGPLVNCDDWQALRGVVAPTADQHAADLKCWSCGKPYTLDQRSDADGSCPHCGVEIDLADESGAGLPAAGSVEAERAAYSLTDEQIDRACDEIYLSAYPSQREFERAIARAVLAALALAKPVAAGELPPLPHRAKDDHGVWYFTEAQMKSYGQQCADSRPAGDDPEDDGPDHGETVLCVQEALGITRTGWVSPDVIMLRLSQLKARVESAGDSRPAGGVADEIPQAFLDAFLKHCCKNPAWIKHAWREAAATLAASAALTPHDADIERMLDDTEASAVQAGASIDTPEFARLLLAWHEARLDKSRGTDVSAQVNAIIAYIDAQRAAPVAGAVPDDVAGDAERFRWLAEDHADPEVRDRCRDILGRLGVMSISAARMVIDAARAAAPNTEKE